MKSSNKCLKLLVLGSVATSIVPMISIAEDKVAIQVQEYQENDGRIDVSDGKLSIEHDFGPDHTLNAEVDWDTISGASPSWDSLTGASQTVESDAVSGPSPCIDEDGNYYELCRDTRELDGIVGDGHLDIDELAYQNSALTDKRHSVAFLYTYRTPTKRNELSLGASYSEESDFINTGVSAEYLMYTDRTKNRAVTAGASIMKNEVLDYLENKWNNYDLINAQVGITQVFNSTMVGKLNAYYMLEDGHLSNPYFNVIRRINVIADQQEGAYFKNYLSRESRPDNRTAGGISAQLAKTFPKGTSWQLSYRYYQDNWAVDSHTLESKSYHRVSEKFRLSPGLRYYKQGEANFFKAQDAEDNIFDETGYASADHRLGDYDSWTVQFATEYLQSRELTWNIVTGYQAQSSGLKFGWVNLGVQYKY